MTADPIDQTYGFPAGYFVIRSVATGRLLDVEQDEVEDSTELILWPEKDNSLVESMRSPESNNQVFFIDTSGALCSRSSGHAIDIEGDRLVLRHRRPISHPFPNEYSHPLPIFSYSMQTKQISMNFTTDPSYNPASTSTAWKEKTYILSSIPMRKPRGIIEDASAFFSSALSSPLEFLSGAGKPKTTPEEVFNGEIDLDENEVLEQDRGEEGEVDDSPEGVRRVRMLTIVGEEEYVAAKAIDRRRWEVIPLRKTKAHYKN